jgi:mutator protein MutT
MNPIRLAGCVIRDETGKILLLHRNKNGVKQWELPGGKLEKGESAEAAAIREVREELGVDVTEAKRLGEAAFREDGRRFSYEWYEAKIAAHAEPSIREPQSFDELLYWDINALTQRDDLSANLRNMLDSSVLKREQAMNSYEKLHEIVRLLDVRFPDGKDIFQRVSRLAEETGELAQAVNHAEGTGIKREKYGEPDRGEMAKEIQDVMRAALGIAQHYGLEAELEKSIDDAYVRLSGPKQ